MNKIHIIAMRYIFKTLSNLTCAVTAFIAFQGCSHTKNLHPTEQANFTTELVQKEIYIGMKEANVASRLGCPHTVTRDKEGRATWVYDKFATKASYSNSRSIAGVGVATIPSGIAKLNLVIEGEGRYSKGLDASAQCQRNLTVVLKFDRRHRLENFSYHSSDS